MNAGAATIAAVQNRGHADDGDCVDGGHDLRRVFGPPDNGEGDAKFVEAQHGHEGDHGDGESAKRFGALGAREDDSYAESPEPGDDGIEQPPGESV